MAEDPALFVRSLDRGLAVLRAFDVDHTRLSVSAVAERTGLSRATARRFLHTLLGLGYAARDGDDFVLRPKVMELGHLYLSTLSVPEVAEPHMRALSGALGETVSLAVLDDSDMIIVGRIVPRRLMTLNISIGTRLPAFCTALGRAALSAVDDELMQRLVRASHLRTHGPATMTDHEQIIEVVRKARRHGYAMVDEELEVGLRAIAMPVFGPDHRLAASVNISTPARRGSARSLVTDMLPKLQLAVHAIEADLALTTSPPVPPDPLG